MTIEEKVFVRCCANFSGLQNYGFEARDGNFVLERLFMNDAFKAVVIVDKNGRVSGQVYDVETQDVYLPLRVENETGGFAQRVRNAYEAVLRDIKEKCFIPNVFTGLQANRLARVIFEKYGDEPDFPWEKYASYGVFRNPESGKWYGLIMNIDKSKLNRKLSGAIDVMNLKNSAEKIPELLKQQGFYPAYHMNKKSWISVVLDDTVNDGDIMALIEDSRSFSQLKRKKR